MKITANSILLNVTTGEYPLTLSQVRQALQNVSFAEEPDEDALSGYDYALVLPQPQPTGDVVYEGAPVLVSGQFQQNWLVRSFTPEELATELANQKTNKLSQLDLLQSNTLAKGASYVFPDGQTGHIQLRAGDRANINGLYQRAKEAIAENEEMTFYFRDYEDILHPLTPLETKALGLSAVTLYYAILQPCWALKDQIKAATTLAELPAIPEELTTS